MSLADYIIVLDNRGQIAEQGTWEDLRPKFRHVGTSLSRENEGDDDEARDHSRAEEQIQISSEQTGLESPKTTHQAEDNTLYGKPPSCLRMILGIAIDE